MSVVRIPSRANRSMSVSMLKRSIRPRMTSLTRGCVTPSRFAVWAWVRPRAAIAFCRLSISSAPRP